MISIFTPTHESSFLPRIYQSLVAQTIADWQWVILYNNGGRPIGFPDPRVKEIVLEYQTMPWVGPLKALACRQCDGDILLELDHDDLLLPTALEAVTAAFTDPKIGFVYSNAIHAQVQADGSLTKTPQFDERYGWRYRETVVDGVPLDEPITFDPAPDSVSKIWFAPNHLRAFRRSVYDQVGGYAMHMRVLDDQDLMCRLYLATRFHHLDAGLYLYRVTGSNAWIQHNQEIQENVLRIYDNYIDSVARRWADLNGLRCLDLGGRLNPAIGYESVDLKDAAVVCDLNGRWPFEDGSVGVVRASDLIEHLRDPLHTMTELYRVLAPGGWAFITVPSTDGRGAFQDPTHVSFWNENSFAYYTKAEKARYIDTPVRFSTSRLYTTEKNAEGVCWTVAHLISLKDNYRPAGLVEL